MQRTPRTSHLQNFAAMLIALLLTFFLTSIINCSAAYASKAKETNSSPAPALIKPTYDENGKNLSKAPGAEEEMSAIDLNLGAEIPGVGSFFANLLDSLIYLTADTENKFGKLISSFPQVFPDLYKVFITL